MSGAERTIVPTDAPPTEPSHEIGVRKPALLTTEYGGFCPGCGEPIAARALLENLVELDVVSRVIAVIGIGCYTGFSMSFDLETVQALHGRAPSVATGVKRMQPDAVVFTLQGDGDMVNEGLQEVLHTAARGESVTAILLNNGVFGETGGHMTATSVLGQRTKNSLDGRDAAYHGYPIKIADLLAQLDGVELRGPRFRAQRGRGGEDQEDDPQGLRHAARRARLLVRRDPHDVPHRLVHRRARRRRVHGRDPRPGPHHGRAQRRLTANRRQQTAYTLVLLTPVRCLSGRYKAASPAPSALAMKPTVARRAGLAGRHRWTGSPGSHRRRWAPASGGSRSGTPTCPCRTSRTASSARCRPCSAWRRWRTSPRPCPARPGRSTGPWWWGPTSTARSRGRSRRTRRTAGSGPCRIRRGSCSCGSGRRRPTPGSRRAPARTSSG